MSCCERTIVALSPLPRRIQCPVAEKLPGYLFDVPEALCRGGLYIPLVGQVVMPGGAVVIHLTSKMDADIFARLDRADEIFTAVLMRDDVAKEGSLHSVGTLSLVADHSEKQPGEWTTIIAGIVTGEARRALSHR